MKIVIFLTVAVNLFNLIHRSAGECKTSTKCLPPNPNIKPPVEIGIIYDLYEEASQNQALIQLDDIVCQVVKQFGGCLTVKRYPGASVVSTNNGIKCNDDCFRLREDACKAIVDPDYTSTCASTVSILMTPLEDCTYNCESDQVLEDNGTLRCNLGIPKSKIPALMFNKEYDACNDFSSADELKKFLCTTYGTKLEGCN